MAGWLLASVVKFLLTPSAMVARGIEPLWVVGVTTVGAAIGVAIFFYAGKALLSVLDFHQGLDFYQDVMVLVLYQVLLLVL